MNKKNKEEQIEDIVNLIDEFMKKDGGHMNLSISKEGKVSREEIIIDNRLDCGQSACKTPTLFEGLDSTEEE